MKNPLKLLVHKIVTWAEKPVSSLGPELLYSVALPRQDVVLTKLYGERLARQKKRKALLIESYKPAGYAPRCQTCLFWGVDTCWEKSYRECTNEVFAELVDQGDYYEGPIMLHKYFGCFLHQDQEADNG